MHLMELNERMKKERFEEMDALRGIAALFVVFFILLWEDRNTISFLKLGVTGDDLFFLISGFVIVMSLQQLS